MRITAHAMKRFQERVNPNAHQADIRRAFRASVKCDVAMARAATPNDPSKPSNPDLIASANLSELYLNLDVPCYFVVRDNSIITVMPGPEPDVCDYLRKKLEEAA